IVQFARLEFIAWRYFLMRPRAVGDGSFEQRAIFESVSENRFEEVQIGNLFGIFQNTVNYKQTPEACHRTERRNCPTCFSFSAPFRQAEECRTDSRGKNRGGHKGPPRKKRCRST